MKKIEPFSVVRINPATKLPVTRNEYIRFHKWAVRKIHPTIRVDNLQDTNMRNLRTKTLVINYYGGKCAVCGIDDLRVLELHHTNKDGKEQRENLGVRGAGPFYRALIKNDYPTQPELTVLCANHHAIEHSGDFWTT